MEISDAASALNVSMDYLHRLIASGRLQAHPQQGVPLLSRVDVLAVKEEQKAITNEALRELARMTRELNLE